jgi:hypothetical protein
LYYLPAPIQDELLKTVAARISRLLTPGGIVMLVNHYFPLPNAETRLTLRIHRAFQWSPAFVLLSEHRRAFFLATLLGNAGPGRDMSGTWRVPIQSLGSANSSATEPGRTA